MARMKEKTLHVKKDNGATKGKDERENLERQD